MVEKEKNMLFFDIVFKIDLVEVDNVVNNVLCEIS